MTRERTERAVIVDCQQLTHIYRVGLTDVIALQGLDLRVEAGEMVVVIGASGSGKSTLMKILAGLLQPTAGQVVVAGVDLARASQANRLRLRRDRLGIISQHSGENLLPYLTARQNVALSPQLAGQPNPNGRASAMLEIVGLVGRDGHRQAQLSGGEQQRVALAAALAREPQVLLADEPTGSLDSESTDAHFSLMRRLSDETGLTQIVVTHDQDAVRHADRIIAIRDGRVASEQHYDEQGSLDEVLMIDSIGRLQLTSEHLAALHDSRVRATLTDTGIEIRPQRSAHADNSETGDDGQRK